jgi:hypothetical protein
MANTSAAPARDRYPVGIGMPFRDHDREALDDDEFPDPDPDDEDEDEDGTATLLCPHCRVPVYEEAEQCPHCGTYMTEEEDETPPRMKPLWIVAGTVAVLVIVYFWIRYGV